MINLIILVILLISFLGIIVIVGRKIPVLVGLPSQKIKRGRIFNRTIVKVKNNGFVRELAPKNVLQKGLSKFRILSLKTEKKTADWLKELRQKSAEKKKSFKDDYWKRVREE